MKTMRIIAITIALFVVGQPLYASDGDTAQGPTLYERLGSWDGINQIVGDTIALHVKNEDISHYFDGVDLEALQAHVTAFFAAGTGGPNKYEGRDMTTTHASMGMSDADFDSAVADVLKAVGKNVDDQAVADEVNAILQSLRPAVMGLAEG
jgi:hemoglobin